MESSNYIHSLTMGDTVEIIAMVIPPHLRGAGLGRKAYEAWEKTLPATIKYVTLEPVDAGDGFSGGFWERMGFVYKYAPSDDPDFHVPQTMTKGVNGVPTPQPMDYAPE